MAQILVEEDWGREADENPFPSGGGVVNIEGELIYVYVSQPQPPSPLQSVEELNK